MPHPSGAPLLRAHNPGLWRTAPLQCSSLRKKNVEIPKRFLETKNSTLKKSTNTL